LSFLTFGRRKGGVLPTMVIPSSQQQKQQQQQQQQQHQRPHIMTEVVEISGWPTDVVSIDYTTTTTADKEVSSSLVSAHTYILFLPGNPGLVGWYIPALYRILEELGPGFAVRGISYAGHGCTDDIVQVEAYEGDTDDDASSNKSKRNVDIPWTLHGQLEHKMIWMEQYVLKNEDKNQPTTLRPQFIFLSHSIGSYFVERMLVIQSDWRYRTIANLYWMPFIRMAADSWWEQFKLDSVAQQLPQSMVMYVAKQMLHMFHTSKYCNHLRHTWFQLTIPDLYARDIAIRLTNQTTFARNFLELGLEEIRDLPQIPDVSTSIPTILDTSSRKICTYS
jgi:Lipid-droplet associated hydrolase